LAAANQARAIKAVLSRRVLVFKLRNEKSKRSVVTGFLQRTAVEHSGLPTIGQNAFARPLAISTLRHCAAAALSRKREGSSNRFTI